CDQITDKALQLLGQSQCKLEVLILNRLSNVTDIGVHAITSGQDALQMLHIKHLAKVTQAVLNSIVAPKMWSFCFKTNAKSWCSGTVMANFLSKNPSIKELKLQTDVEHVPVIAQNLQDSLEELKTNFQSMMDSDIDALADYCPNLKRIDLNGAKNIGKESLIKLFQACTQLEELDLGYCSRLSIPPECEVLWTLPQSLVSLSLCGLMLQDGQILVECITRLPHVTSLKLCGVPGLNDCTLAQIVEQIGCQITELNVSGIGVNVITDVGLQSVAKFCTSLECLHISLLRQVTGQSLKPIFLDAKRASKIRVLSVNSKMMDVGMLDLIMSSCPNLETLDLSGLSDVTDTMVMDLADHAPRLSQVNLKSCKLVTDTAICYLCGICPLKSLCLSGLHSLTDKSIFCIASSCPQLEEIYLNGCACVSPVAVQYLRDCCLGRLYASHSIPNAKPNQLMAKNLDTGEYCRADLL
ncbi:F-box/lrr-repeat protein 20, partial [Plakobranchus ocellatus]